MDKTFIEGQLNNFKSLCDKAQLLIFENIINSNIMGVKFFDVLSIDDDVAKLSPIEQILYIAFQIYDIDSNQTTPKPSYIDKQHLIECNGKTYITDFFIDLFLSKEGEGMVEYELKKPIIIECDGFEYHSTKKQMTHDYERENNLKTAGYNVFRFTGSQIYSNPFECVKTIYKELENIKNNKEYEEI